MSRRDLQGLYHPSETWRCLGYAYNNNSTHFNTPVVTLRGLGTGKILMGDSNAYGAPTGSIDMSGQTFPDRYIQVVQNGTAYTAAANTYQDCLTISVTKGMWNLSGWLEFSNVGTSNGATVVRGSVNTASANNGIMNPLVNDFVVNYGAQINSAGTLHIHKYAVFATATQSFYLKMNVSNTALSTYIMTKGRVLAERIDDPIGGPL